jgi:putative ABC transport system permease protein
MKPEVLYGLALRNIRGNAFRSCLIAFCAMLVAGVLLSAAVVTKGAQDSLRLAIERLGADIVVVPQGAETDARGTVRLGTLATLSMQGASLGKIAAIPGVKAAAPRWYLGSIAASPYCSAAELYVVAFDPKTDFALRPWIKGRLGSDLAAGQAIGGSLVSVPEGQKAIKVFGSSLQLRANLEPTGTDLDQTLFVTMDTAAGMMRASTAGAPLLHGDRVSEVMIRVAPGTDPPRTAIDVLSAIPDGTPVLSPGLFGAYRTQMAGLLRGLLIILGMTIALSAFALVLVFSLAAHQRRRQMGVLRALGASRGEAMLTFLAEADILALAGGIAGAAIAAVGIALLRAPLVETLGFSFAFPSTGTLAAIVAGGLGVALVVVSLAAFVPALRVSRQEPASSMKE